MWSMTPRVIFEQVKEACNGDLNKVVRVVKLTGFVNSENDFTEQPKVPLMQTLSSASQSPALVL